VDLALRLDVLAVCAAFAIVGAILLGASEFEHWRRDAKSESFAFAASAACQVYFVSAGLKGAHRATNRRAASGADVDRYAARLDRGRLETCPYRTRRRCPMHRNLKPGRVERIRPSHDACQTESSPRRER
jgi:hypothetical protein